MPFPSDPRLGRLTSPETYKAAVLWPMARLLSAEAPSQLPAVQQWAQGPIRDQLQTPECVGFAGWDWEFTAPNASTDDAGDPNGDALYALAQAQDGIPLPHDGSTVLGLMKALNAQGRIGNYLWATNMNDAITWLSLKGPVVVGMNWYNSMFNPDAGGFVTPSGGIAGGHAFLLFGAHNDQRYVDAQNSWGDWGPLHGNFKLSYNDLARLLFSEGGECACALEPTAPPPPPAPPAPPSPPAPVPPGPDIRPVDVGLNRLDYEAIQRVVRDGHLRNYGDPAILKKIIDNQF